MNEKKVEIRIIPEINSKKTEKKKNSNKTTNCREEKNWNENRSTNFKWKFRKTIPTIASSHGKCFDSIPKI